MRFIKRYLLDTADIATTSGFLVVFVPAMIAIVSLLRWKVEGAFLVGIISIPLVAISGLLQTVCRNKYVVSSSDYRKVKGKLMIDETHNFHLIKVKKGVVIETGYSLWKDKDAEIIPVSVPRVVLGDKMTTISLYMVVSCGVRVNVRIVLSKEKPGNFLSPAIGVLSAQAFYDEVVHRGFSCIEDWISSGIYNAAEAHLPLRGPAKAREVLREFLDRERFVERLPGIFAVEIYTAV